MLRLFCDYNNQNHSSEGINRGDGKDFFARGFTCIQSAISIALIAPIALIALISLIAPIDVAARNYPHCLDSIDYHVYHLN